MNSALKEGQHEKASLSNVLGTVSSSVPCRALYVIPRKKKIFFFSNGISYKFQFSTTISRIFLLIYCLYNLNSKTLVCWSLPLTSLSLGIHALKNPQILDLQNKSCLCFNFMPEVETETTMLVVSVKLVRKCV